MIRLLCLACVFLGSVFVYGEVAGLGGEASRVRILLAIDESAENVGSTVLAGGRAVESAFYTAAAKVGLNDRITVDILGVGTGRLTPTDILNYYANLQTSPDEALVFYYTGHGATDPQKGHFFQMSGGSLRREDVLSAMKAHNPRLAVMMTDCCSGLARYLPGRATETIERSYTVARSSMRPPSILYDLFFKQKGIVDATAAQTPQLAWAPPEGGLFSQTLAELLAGGIRQADVDGNGEVVWNEFLRNLRWNTNERFRALKASRSLDLALSSSGIREASEQTPQLFKLPSFDMKTSVQLLRMKAVVDGVRGRDETPNGRPGMTLLVDATVWNAKSKTVQVAAFFRFDDGTSIDCKVAKYSNVDGKLVTFVNNYPIKYDAARMQYIELYIPYAVIPRATLDRQVGFYVNIRETESGALLGGSPFLYERFSPANRPGADAGLDQYLPSSIPDAVTYGR